MATDNEALRRRLSRVRRRWKADAALDGLLLVATEALGLFMLLALAARIAVRQAADTHQGQARRPAGTRGYLPERTQAPAGRHAVARGRKALLQAPAQCRGRGLRS
jgi:hypothetical protein